MGHEDLVRSEHVLRPILSTITSSGTGKLLFSYQSPSGSRRSNRVKGKFCRKSKANPSMSWKIEIKPTAEKSCLKLDKKTRQRIKNALAELESASDPFLQTKVRDSTGRLDGDYRLRVRQWRILFRPDKAPMTIHGYAILPRKDAY
jgi:mRNA-degrading endonuclease RelE of RelBE toxin-antitoxin system